MSINPNYFSSVTHSEQEIMAQDLGKQLNSDCIKKNFTKIVAQEWNILSLLEVECSILNSFRNHLDHHIFQLDIQVEMQSLGDNKYNRIPLGLRTDHLIWTKI